MNGVTGIRTLALDSVATSASMQRSLRKWRVGGYPPKATQRSCSVGRISTSLTVT